jgi:hypothetical protein
MVLLLEIDSCVRRRQQRLLRCVGSERRGIQALGCAAATAETGHCLQKRVSIEQAISAVGA